MARRRLVLTALTVAAVATIINCGSVAMSDGKVVLPTDCDFNDITGITVPAPCSPVFKSSKFIGIAINVPKTVEIAEDFKLNICARYRHQVANSFSLGAPFINSIVFVAVDKATQEVYSGQVEEDENVLPDPDEDEDDAEIDESLRVGGYVNPDLVEVIGLPKKAARYVVYATVGTYKSNVMDLEVKEAE